MREATESLRLLNGSPEFVLTYEDRDGDWMLVGDVPWEYVSSCHASADKHIYTQICIETKRFDHLLFK